MGTSSRLGATAALLVLAAATPLDAATIATERFTEVLSESYHHAIAVGPDCVVHRLYRDGALADTTAVLKYARGGLGYWESEVVDTREPAFGENAIAIDSEGRVHVAYYWNNREDPSESRAAVIYAVREPEGWVHTTLSNPNNISSLSLALGPDGRPRVAWVEHTWWGPNGRYDYHQSPPIVATFNGSGWDREEIRVEGFQDWFPGDLHVDAEGNNHLLAFPTRGTMRYVTDASGAWELEALPEEVYPARLAFDGDGRAHMVGYQPDDRLRHFVREPWGWVDDPTFPDKAPTYPRVRYALNLETGPGRRVNVVFVGLSQQVWDGQGTREMYTFDGTAWAHQVFATRTESAEVLSTAVGPDNAVHVICNGQEAQRTDYFRLGGTELGVDVSKLRVVPARNGVRVKGRVTVRNVSPCRAPAQFLRFARAEGDEYESGDRMMGRRRRQIPSLRPGEKREYRVNLIVRAPGEAENLLVLLEPRLARFGLGDPFTAAAVPLEVDRTPILR